MGYNAILSSNQNYLENYIIAEQKEKYRLERFWWFWIRNGLFVALEMDERFIKDFVIMGE